MDQNKTYQINLTVSTVIKVLVVLAVAVAVYFLKNIVLVLLTAVVIASALDPAASWFTKYKIPRVLAVLLVYVTVLAVVAFTLFFLVPPLFEDFSDIALRLPAQLSSFVANDPAWHSMFTLLGNFSTNISVQDVVTKGLIGSPLPGNIFDFTKALLAHIIDFGLIIVISFYLAVQKNGVENFLRVVIPGKSEEYVIDLWRRTEVKIGRWAQGQFLLAVIIGPLVFLGLALFQVKYALILAIVAAVFELIPIFGPVLSAVPAVILGFGDSATLGLILIAFYVIIHQFENHLLYPLVVKKIIGVNPLVVIISLIIGYQLAGFLGVILAVPLATLLMEFINDLEKRKQQAR